MPTSGSRAKAVFEGWSDKCLGWRPVGGAMAGWGAGSARNVRSAVPHSRPPLASDILADKLDSV